MLIVTAAGNVGKGGAKTKTVGDQTVTEFSVATNRKVKGEDVTTWLDCAIWGSRGAALEKHITQGDKITVTGELSMYAADNGKTYLKVRVSDVALQGGKRDGAAAGAGASSNGAGPEVPPF